MANRPRPKVTGANCVPAASATHAGKALDPLDELLKERRNLFSPVPGRGEGESHRQRVFRTEPRVDVLHPEETIDEEATVNEQGQRRGHFRRDEGALQAKPAAVPRR